MPWRVLGPTARMNGKGVEMWIPSRGRPLRLTLVIGVVVVFTGLFLLELAWVHGTSNFVRALEFQPITVDVPLTVFIYVVLAFPIIMLPILVAFDTRGIGLGPAGIQVVTHLTNYKVPWASLRPSIETPKGPWGFIGYVTKSWAGSGSFWLSKEQAAAILSDPRAPRELFPPEYWSWVNLTPPPRERTS